jgi:hypothetical protein
MSLAQIFKLRVASIILIAIGYGWAGGHFIPANSPVVAYLFQAIIIAILLALALGFFSTPPPRWAVRGLTIFTSISLAINIVNIVKGAYGAGGSFGSHNTLADLVPIGILIAGDILWLILIMPFFREIEANPGKHKN